MPKEAEALKYALSLDFKTLFVSLMALAVVFVALWGLITKIQEIFGIETKSMRERRLTQEKMESLGKDIDSLKQYREKDRQNDDEYHDKMMKLIEKLDRNLVKKSIEDMRWTILDFGNSIRDGRKYDLDAYNHIKDIHDEYEITLKENDMENGRVTLVMELINEKYATGLRDGFPV